MFSDLRLFSPIGSTITDMSFFIPGANPNPVPSVPNMPATISGFGAVYSDVDREDRLVAPVFRHQQ